MPSSQTYAVVGAARLFALLAIGGPIVWLHQEQGLLALAAVSCVWIYQGVTATRRELELSLSPMTEAAAIGVIGALAMTDAPVILAALVVPPLYATAIAGIRTMIRTVLVELIAVVALGLMWWEEITNDQAVAIFTWSMAGLGLSLIAAVTFSSDRAPDPVAPYRDAQEHLRQLIDLAGSLSSGLDVGALGGELLSQVGDDIPNRALVLYVPRGEALTPVASTVELEAADAIATETLAGDVRLQESDRNRPIEIGEGFAFRVSDQAIVAGLRPTGADTTLPLPLSAVARDLSDTAVKLDAALLFAQFRDAATADERNRLAREMHDGVAQDIASLGYIIDALAARPADEQQAKALAMLRERVSKVVAEVRQSVMNLRTSIGENESLGAAISNVARHLSESSGIPIRVRLDEQPTRLRPEVEAELFRIAQESINNAVKHARATSIDVRCQVYAPEAIITVTDDGVGLQAARADSHGLKIMRERARLIGAELVVRDNASRGLTVSVALKIPRSAAGSDDSPILTEQR
ncbi:MULTISPECIES: sensor histidine kinase [unclassified Nocardioides]|uniref:sensor histidine kinase n=1 Tax=unclassified Nocardioides TaxID=2615069 RepID=UPI00115181B1|nr:MULTISPECIES: sensor histidine kinase [unclassified Nocardioides]TQK70617.1 histidine kinase/DNA gyrase B/HSP90-like ATPase [Nocardioides sp. SLBN-35]WGX99995.1 sensor histidine kinase [Nocardioides sp. QY071]